MKKYGVIAILLGLLFVTGCGKNNQVVCTGKVEVNNTTSQIKVTGKIKNDKVVETISTYTFDNEQEAQSYCDVLKSDKNDSQSENQNEEQKSSYECNGKNVVLTDKASEENSVSRDMFIESLENEALACK